MKASVITCNVCGRTETQPYDLGDSCYEACGGVFVDEIASDDYQRYSRLGLVANRVSASLFGHEGAYGAEIVAGVRVAGETNWMMKECLQTIIERGCSCSMLSDPAEICPACYASETLDKVNAKQRRIRNTVIANIENRKE